MTFKFKTNKKNECYSDELKVLYLVPKKKTYYINKNCDNKFVAFLKKIQLTYFKKKIIGLNIFTN